MRVVIFSDTHSFHRRVNIPDGDVLIHCGDITLRGEMNIMKDFIDWYREFPHKRKLFIQGNHEIGLQHNKNKRNELFSWLQNSGITYLEHAAVELDGIKYFGSPYNPQYKEWEWQLPRGKSLAAKWASIPDDTNVLITHSPPFGILDRAPRKSAFSDVNYENVGCQDLYNRVMELKDLKIHTFGHIHQDGSKTINIEDKVFINGAVCDEKYQPIQKPVVIDI